MSRVVHIIVCVRVRVIFIFVGGVDTNDRVRICHPLSYVTYMCVLVKSRCSIVLWDVLTIFKFLQEQ
jgi:hypothetical protein